MGNNGNISVMPSLTYTSRAKEDLAHIAVYIAQQSTSREIATRFTARLREKCRALASMQGTLGTARPELREDIRSIPAYGYVIFFQIPGYDVRDRKYPAWHARS